MHLFIKLIDHYETEILLTFSFVMGLYAFCNYIHISGPLAMVVMGLMVDNFKQDIVVSDITQHHVHKFWELVDVILNAIFLFRLD